MNNRCNIYVYYKYIYIKRKFYGYLMCKFNCYILGIVYVFKKFYICVMNIICINICI